MMGSSCSLPRRSSSSSSGYTDVAGQRGGGGMRGRRRGPRGRSGSGSGPDYNRGGRVSCRLRGRRGGCLSSPLRGKDERLSSEDDGEDDGYDSQSSSSSDRHAGGGGGYDDDDDCGGRRAVRHSVYAEVADRSISSFYPTENNWVPHPTNPSLHSPKTLADLCTDAVCRSLAYLDGELPPGLPRDVVDSISQSLTARGALNATTLRALRFCDLGTLTLTGCRGVSDKWLAALAATATTNTKEEGHEGRGGGRQRHKQTSTGEDYDDDSDDQDGSNCNRSAGFCYRRCGIEEEDEVNDEEVCHSFDDSSSRSTSSFVSASSTHFLPSEEEHTHGSDREDIVSSPTSTMEEDSDSNSSSNIDIFSSPASSHDELWSQPPHYPPVFPSPPRLPQALASTTTSSLKTKHWTSASPSPPSSPGTPPGEDSPLFFGSAQNGGDGTGGSYGCATATNGEHQQQPPVLVPPFFLPPAALGDRTPRGFTGHPPIMPSLDQTPTEGIDDDSAREGNSNGTTAAVSSPTFPPTSPPTSPYPPISSALTRLDLRNSQRLTDRGLLQLSDRSSSLEVAMLDDCHGISGKGLLAFANSYGLRILSAANCRRLGDEAVANVGHLTGLEALNLGGCRCLTDRALEAAGGLTDLRRLDLSQCDLLTDNGLRNLHGLQNIEELSLGWCREITDEGLRIIARQPHRRDELRVLRLARCPISDQGMEYLAELAELRELDLNGCTKVSSMALGNALEKLTNLTSLDVSYCPGILRSPWQGKIPALKSLELCYSGVRDAHLGRLTSLPSLEELNLDSCPMGDWAVAHLADGNVAPNLTCLDLADTELTDAGVAKIASGFGGKMKRLSLFYCNVTNAGLRHLSSMTKLEVLNLDSREIGNEGLKYLCGLPLQSLDIFSGRVTDVGCAYLSKIKTLTSLELCGGGVGDLGCAHLASLSNLTSLNLSQNERITNRGAASLAALSNLRALNLANTRVNSDALRFLGTGLTKLRSLALYGCGDIDEDGPGLDSLRSDLPALRCLRLNNVASGEDGMMDPDESDGNDEDEDDVDVDTWEEDGGDGGDGGMRVRYHRTAMRRQHRHRRRCRNNNGDVNDDDDGSSDGSGSYMSTGSREGGTEDGEDFGEGEGGAEDDDDGVDDERGGAVGDHDGIDDGGGAVADHAVGGGEV